MIKRLIQTKLEGYVKKYLAAHPEVKVVAVVGSVGKTSTKMAIGTVLSQQFTIRLHEGNHNAELSAPLAILGIEYPDNIRSLSEWRKVFAAARRRIREPADVQVIVQEVGTDGIGQVPRFGTYVTPDIAVVTAVSPEHMEFFGTIENVAAEELSAANFSKHAIINRDDVDGSFAELITNSQLDTYGSSAAAEYSISVTEVSAGGQVQAILKTLEWGDVPVSVQVVGEHSARSLAGAAAVGAALGMTAEAVKAGIERVRPVSGRMNILRGQQDAIIIDDSYNSSPSAAEAALRVLYQVQAAQHIAVLGSMNELGDSSREAHEAIGSLCDPNHLAHVITVGREARELLAPAAQRNGCHVVSFDSALQAGAYVHRVMEPGAAILFKGSQGGIYLEEAIKIILHSTDDEAQLVRQSSSWLEKKQAFFDSLSEV